MDASSLFSSMGSSFTTILPTVFLFIVITGVVGFIAYYLARLKNFNVEVEIISPRAGNGYKIFKDRGGYVKTKEKEKEFKLLKRRETVPFVELSHIVSQGKKNYLRLIEIDHGELVPLKTKIDYEAHSMRLTPEDVDIKMFRSQRFQRNRALWDKKNFIEKFMPVILIAVPTVLMIVMMYVVMKDMTVISANFKSAMASLAQAGGGPL